jgi:hypothetical protein
MQVFTYPNMVVRVHRPEITEEEHERRMKLIHKAAENVLKSKQKKRN